MTIKELLELYSQSEEYAKADGTHDYQFYHFTLH